MSKLVNRIQEIKKKGFTMPVVSKNDTPIIQDNPYVPVDFSKIKVGVKQLPDATLNLGCFKRVDPRLGDKDFILKAIRNHDHAAMRQISNYFYNVSGIYRRLCNYLADLYRFDWIVTPYINDSASIRQEKILSDFNKVLSVLDNFGVKKVFKQKALRVVKDGCYYGYKIQGDTPVLQDLDPAYCRSRFKVNDRPAVEFNMKYFDDNFRDASQKMRVLNLFPTEFLKGYKLYKEGKLTPDFAGDESGWYLLDVDSCVKFSVGEDDFPPLISVIPAIIDLDEMQDLDKKKMEQQLLKIIIQQMPLDKNGDLVFDVEEAMQLHRNAVNMLGKAIGVDVLTTFADVSVENLADTSTKTTTDDLEKYERALYNQSGVAENLFNTDGNLALEKSILNDEALMYNLILQFEEFLNDLIKQFNKSPKKIKFKAQILSTTIYNYKDMAKLYKEQMQVGYSKMLAQIALGQSQSSILANAYFENDILDLVNVFIPPLMSSTMNGDFLTNRGGNSNTPQKQSSSSGDGAGRKEKANDEKSEKTIANIESKN